MRNQQAPAALTPATLEQIERVLLDDDCTTYIDARKLRRVAELVKPLTVAQPGVTIDWKDQLYPLIPWDKVKSTNVVIMAYDMAGQQVCQFGKIAAPKPRPRTTDELSRAYVVHLVQTHPNYVEDEHEQIIGDAWATLAMELAAGANIKDLCTKAGVSLETTE